MNPIDDDYLWDKRGHDREIERLEALLAPFAYGSVAPGSPKSMSQPNARRSHRRVIGMAIAACVGLLAVLGIAFQWRLSWPTDAAWTLRSIDGEVRVDDRVADDSMVLSVGSELRTGNDGHARLKVARIGEARVGANSRVRLEQTGTGKHRLQLVEGTLWARIWAPPQQFGVHVAGTEVLDLGCEFIVESDVHGNGSLRVSSGWVLVESAGQEVLVPEGARVVLAAGNAPGTPHDERASPAFVQAVHAIDAMSGAVSADSTEITRLLAQVGQHDAISLLSLLSRHPHLADGPLYDHLARMLGASSQVSRAAVIDDPAQALQPWWDALPYPRVKRWWLHWPDMLPGSDADVDSFATLKAAAKSR